MKDYHYLITGADKILDYILNFLIAYLCYLVSVSIPYPEYQLKTSVLFLIISVTCLILSSLYSFHNVYVPMRTKSAGFFCARLFIVTLECFGVLVAYAFLSEKELFQYYIAWAISFSALSYAVLSTKKVIMLSILHGIRVTNRNIKHILIVTDSQEKVDDYMTQIMENPQYGYDVLGYVGNLNIVGLPHLGTTGDLDRVLKEQKPDEVIMAFDTVRKKLINRYITVCNNNCSKILMIPAVCGYFKSEKQVATVGSLPMIDLKSNPLDNRSSQIAKRLLDIVVSFALIIATSPVMLFAAIGVKLSSKGPVLFRQTRIGKDNKEFTILKFRSMYVNDKESTGWSSEEDPRITRFGSFIRRFAIDELPQFFNVLKGDMSLVGPRPEIPFFVDKFKKEVPLYMLKHTLRPGITGLAQIKGLRGDTSIQARIDEDLNYIENWTLWGDVKILLKTPFHMINRHEKYAKRERMEMERSAALGKNRREEVPRNDDDEA